MMNFSRQQVLLSVGLSKQLSIWYLSRDKVVVVQVADTICDRMQLP